MKNKIKTLLIHLNDLSEVSFTPVHHLEYDIELKECCIHNNQLCNYIFLADVVLIDINNCTAHDDVLSLIKSILQVKQVYIIMITEHYDKDLLLLYFRAGVTYFTNNSHTYEISAIIRSIINNSNPIKILINEYILLQKRSMLEFLTPAERELFVLIQKGYSISRISKELYKSERTIKNQLSTLYKKMNVTSRHQLLEKVSDL